eukprot:TRINITY_DN67146_c4_g1_i1.p1 TRINITY_DN67146_c4_g1~~TRINITY_DN67146_c4_g1_i1.p1  ORF type:complete len:357 (+),score=30.63 TRINITY_DN67146_c4_g1_i1:63-1133(+)
MHNQAESSNGLLVGIIDSLRSPPIKQTKGVTKKACTAIILRDVGGPDGIEVLFILRAESPRDRWSGNVAVPGGKQEPQDNGNDQVTAEREALEEIGIDLADASVFTCLGQLDDRRVARRGRALAGYYLSPFVYLQTATETPPMKLQASEIRATRWAKLSSIHWKRVNRGTKKTDIGVVFPWLARVPHFILAFLGLAKWQFPSIRLLPTCADCLANDLNPQTTTELDFELWGLTLRCINDMLLQSLPSTPTRSLKNHPLFCGMSRKTVLYKCLTWPPVTVSNPIVQVLLRALCGYKELSQLWGASPLEEVLTVHHDADNKNLHPVRFALSPANVGSLMFVCVAVGGAALWALRKCYS